MKEWSHLLKTYSTLKSNLVVKKNELSKIEASQIRTDSLCSLYSNKSSELESVVNSLLAVAKESLLDVDQIKKENDIISQNSITLAESCDSAKYSVLILKEKIQQEGTTEQSFELKIKNYNKTFRQVKLDNSILVDQLNSMVNEINALQKQYVEMKEFNILFLKSCQLILSLSNQLTNIKDQYSSLLTVSPSLVNHHCLRDKIAFNRHIYKVLVQCQQLREERKSMVHKLDLLDTKHSHYSNKIKQLSCLMNKFNFCLKTKPKPVVLKTTVNEQQVLNAMEQFKVLDQQKQELIKVLNVEMKNVK